MLRTGCTNQKAGGMNFILELLDSLVVHLNVAGDDTTPIEALVRGCMISAFGASSGMLRRSQS